MKTLIVTATAALFLVIPGAVMPAQGAASHAPHPSDVLPQEDPGQEMPWAIGGVGGAYLLVEPGELAIELFKRDLNHSSVRTDLRAVLAGPDRHVLEDVVMPHLGGSAGDPPGPVQRAVLRTQVERPGVFALNVSTKGDRYGLDVIWGMRTNAAAYVVETARGHRDVAHEEPIVLLDADRPADVGFLPPTREFEIEVEGLPTGVQSLTLYDERGTEVSEIPVVPNKSTRIRDYLRVTSSSGPEGSAKLIVPAALDRGDAPWRLHLPQGQAFVSIDGVTRWQAGDPYRDHAVWTPDPNSWFAFLQHRWMISPYSRTAWVKPGTESEMVFRVHNNASDSREFGLSLECPLVDDPRTDPATRAWLPFVLQRATRTLDRQGMVPVSTVTDEKWAAELSVSSVTLDAGRSHDVEVHFAGPEAGVERVCYVQVTPELVPAVTTYATLTVRGGTPPADQPLEMPFVLEPYAHENAQLGYLPDYPVDNQVYFDLENRPYVLASRQLYRRHDGAWLAIDLSNAVARRVPEFQATTWRAVGTKVAFDADNDVYVLARSGANVALLHSDDRGDTFAAYLLPGREDEPRTWDIEQFSGHNTPVGPPPVVRLTRTYQETETGLRWRSTNDLDLFAATKSEDGSITIPQPMRLTDTSLGFSMHSGIPSTIVSRGAKVHVVWGEATDPDADRQEIPGVPAYVATYDRDTGELGESVFLSFGPPPNDGHNTPSITTDGQGYLHVVVGTHGRPFQYLRSRQPNDAYSGWTEPVKTSEGDLRQTYVGLVSGADDALHLVFREWRSGEQHLDGATWAALAYQSKRPGGDWEAAKVLVAPPLSEYSIYYHRLTVDRTGALFLSYDYWSTMWFYRNDQRGGVSAGSGRPGRGWGRAVLTSPDGGETWSLW